MVSSVMLGGFKCGRLRCGKLSKFEGLLKTVDVFRESISEGCALQRGYEEDLCIPRQNALSVFVIQVHISKP
jgi:hypothetical protein